MSSGTFRDMTDEGLQRWRDNTLWRVDNEACTDAKRELLLWVAGELNQEIAERSLAGTYHPLPHVEDPFG